MIVDAIAPSGANLDLTADLTRLRPGFPVLYIFGSHKTILHCSLEAEAPASVLSAPFREADLITRIDALLADQPLRERMNSAA